MPTSSERSKQVPETCPHCGKPLSPWERVLLSVDHALVCRYCWYRILLDVRESVGPPKAPPSSKDEDHGNV